MAPQRSALAPSAIRLAGDPVVVAVHLRAVAGLPAIERRAARGAGLGAVAEVDAGGFGPRRDCGSARLGRLGAPRRLLADAVLGPPGARFGELGGPDPGPRAARRVDRHQVGLAESLERDRDACDR